MLNTNQSKRKNALKYAIVIPALIAFIMLFQVNVIAKERFSNSFNEAKSIIADQKYVIQSSSTDKELKNYSEEFKKEYKIDLNFKGIKRNSEKEITAINITLNDNKGRKANHKVDGEDAIEPIFINVSKGKNDAYTFAIGKSDNSEEDIEIEITRNEDADFETVSDVEDVDIEMEIADIDVPELPENPTLDFDFPTPPTPPNMVNAPETPKNPNDKKAWAKFEKEMEAFELKMNGADWKKFEEDMKVFEVKMKAFEPHMKKFEQKMRVFEEKMELQGKKIEKKIEKKMKKMELDTKGPKGEKGDK